MFTTPCSDFPGIRSHRTAKTNLTPVREPRGRQRCPRSIAASVTPLFDAISLHVSNLSKNSNDDLPCPPPYGAKTMHMQGNSHAEQLSHHRLDIKSITTETIERI